jgi:hypothetical protein
MMNAAGTEVTVSGRFVIHDPITGDDEKDEFKFVVVSSKQTKAELCDFANVLTMADNTPDEDYGITGERDYIVRDVAQSELIGFVSYEIDGIDTLDKECRDQVHIKIQYQHESGRWVDAWNELDHEAEMDMMMADGTTDFYEPKMYEVEKTEDFIAFWLNFNQTKYIDDV